MTDNLGVISEQEEIKAWEVNDLVDKFCNPESKYKSEVATILGSFNSSDLYQIEEVTLSNDEIMKQVMICNNLSNAQLGACDEETRSGVHRGDHEEIGKLFRQKIFLGDIGIDGVVKILSSAKELGYID